MERVKTLDLSDKDKAEVAKYTLAFKDYNGIATNEYFDIPGNAWSNNNLSAALDEA